MRVRWTRPALNDLADLTAYVAAEHILRVLHGARQWPDVIEDSDS
jgi:plasmid stabilization system protein ParE